MRGAPGALRAGQPAAPGAVGRFPIAATLPPFRRARTVTLAYWPCQWGRPSGQRVPAADRLRPRDPEMRRGRSAFAGTTQRARTGPAPSPRHPPLRPYGGIGVQSVAAGVDLLSKGRPRQIGRSRGTRGCTARPERLCREGEAGTVERLPTAATLVWRLMEPDACLAANRRLPPWPLPPRQSATRSAHPGRAGDLGCRRRTVGDALPCASQRRHDRALERGQVAGRR